jgi:hypothetical protein
MKLDKGSYEFFATLAEAVMPFRSQHRMPDANCEGCRVVQGSGKDRGKIRFGFMGKGDNLVTVDIVVRDIMADPKEYIGNMLEAINQGMKQMDDEVRIIVPTSRSIH